MQSQPREREPRTSRLGLRDRSRVLTPAVARGAPPLSPSKASPESPSPGSLSRPPLTRGPRTGYSTHRTLPAHGLSPASQFKGRLQLFQMWFNPSEPHGRAHSPAQHSPWRCTASCSRPVLMPREAAAAPPRRRASLSRPRAVLCYPYC